MITIRLSQLIGSVALVLSAIWCSSASADTDSGYDIVLLAGQSNMAGRGATPPSTLPDGTPNPDYTDGAPDPAIRMWDNRTNSIVDAGDPIIHSERSGTGVGPGMSFAKAYLKWLRATGHPNRRVLLVGAAYGGTGFLPGLGNDPPRWLSPADASQSHCADLLADYAAHPEHFKQGSDLYCKAIKFANDAVNAAKALEPLSTFRAILWHQGEHDIGTGQMTEYAADRSALMVALRGNIAGAANAPVIMGEPAPCFLEQCTHQVAKSQFAQDVAQYLSDLHHYKNRAAWVSSAGLKHIADGVHFDTASQREMGRRFFSKFWEASQGLPTPVLDLKLHNANFFNIGMTIDGDSAFPSPRSKGNVYRTGSFASVLDTRHGNVVSADANSRSLFIQTNDGAIFNASYTKMAWVMLDGYDFKNNVLSANITGQSHYLFAPAGYPSAGHSLNPQDSVNVFVQAKYPLTLNKWHHLAVSYDAFARTMSLYVDGILVDFASGIAPASPLAATSAITIEMPGWGGGANKGLKGSMISARLYNNNTPLNGAQINAIYLFERDSQVGYGRQ